MNASGHMSTTSTRCVRVRTQPGRETRRAPTTSHETVHMLWVAPWGTPVRKPGRETGLPRGHDGCNMSLAYDGLPEVGSRPDATADTSEPWARLETASEGASRLRLGGRFLPGWAGSLALGLSRLHVTIVRGCACCTSRDKWTAFFDIHALTGAPALASIDYPALASRTQEPAAPAPIRLEKYSLGPVIGGALQLGVRGEDCIGFLGGLIDRMAQLSLVPEELRVETCASVAEDHFRIRTLAGRAPSEDLRRALESLLASCLRPPTVRYPHFLLT
jgi:hypothetical protein